jgi:hypothetical protein
MRTKNSRKRLWSGDLKRGSGRAGITLHGHILDREEALGVARTATNTDDMASLYDLIGAMAEALS